MRTSCSNCNLPVIISATETAGLLCPRCHNWLSAPTANRYRVKRLFFALGLTVSAGIVPCFMVFGSGSQIDQCVSQFLQVFSL